MKKNPADNVEHWPIDKLIPYARNARTHSDEQVAQIAASIREWGWTTPILVDQDGQVIAGHGRLMAARKIGMQTVPVIIAEGWTDAQKRAYVLADNKLAMNAGGDVDLLGVELQEIKEFDFDLSLTGFGDDEIAALLSVKTEGLTDADSTPETPSSPITCRGDVWVMGKHRIMCGDSTSVDDVDKLLAGVPPHLMVTDPPYGVEYDANWRNEAYRH